MLVVQRPRKVLSIVNAPLNYSGSKYEPLSQAVLTCKFCTVLKTYLWLVGNGGMGIIMSTITTILPFPTNQR